MTQSQVSDATGGAIGPGRLASYEQGAREVGIREALILGKVLEQPPSYLLGVIDEIDRDLLLLPAETKIALLSAFRAATPA